MNSMILNLGAQPMSTKTQSYTQEVGAKKDVGDVSFKEAIEEKKEDFNKSDVDKTTKDVEKNPKETSPKEPKKNVLKSAHSIIHDIKSEGMSEKETIEALQLEIMQLLADMLGMTLEEVSVQLEEMKLMPLQMMDENVFREFMASTLGEEGFGLLGDSQTLQKVSKLWEAINDLKTPLEGKELASIEALLAAYSKNSKTITPSEEQENAVHISEHAVHTQESVAKQASATQVIVEQVGANKAKTLKGDKEQLAATNTQLTEMSNSLDMSLPVQNILETQTVKLWQQSTKEATGLMHTEHAPINSQILEKVDFIALKNGNEMTIELDPKELGKLSMRISEHNGIVTTTIRVESERAKEMILQNIELLTKGLGEKGLAVGNFQVDVGQDTHQNEMQKQKQKASKRIQEIIDKQLADLEAEMIEDEKLNVTTSSEVDIKA